MFQIKTFEEKNSQVVGKGLKTKEMLTLRLKDLMLNFSTLQNGFMMQKALVEPL